jgi:hypothetical protein
MTFPTSRLGFYYYTDDRHYTQSDLDTWLPILRSLDAQWLTMLASPDRAVPESFLIGLIESGIEPIIHIPAQVGQVTLKKITPILNSYQRWGVQYVVLLDRPNQRSSWEPSEWSRGELVERFVDHLLPMLEAQVAAGLKPVMPPLEPGGDYWDTAFFEAALESLIRRGKQDIFENLTLAIYAWTYGKPLDWGEGGFARWSEARPYHTPHGCQDQIGFRIFDWYAEISEGLLSRTLPMLVIAGGELPPMEEPSFGNDPHTENNLSIVRALATEEVPVTVLNFSFYHLGPTDGQPNRDPAWFPTFDNPLAIVDKIRLAQASITPKSTTTEEKPLQHYVLLPPRPSPDYTHNWDAIGPFVLAVQPVVGFSTEEARLARRVTLFGDKQALSKSVEDELEAAGCHVMRFTGPASQAFLNHADPSSFVDPESNGDQDPPTGEHHA